MKRTFFFLALFIASALFVLTAYSSQDKPNTVQIRIGDFYIKPETVELKAGQEVKIELVNEGKIEHEFMVGQGIKIEESEHEMRQTTHNTSEGEHEHSKEMHEMHGGMSSRFERDFFEGIEISAQPEGGANFTRVPRHGTMVALKLQSKATLTFKVQTDRKGEWITACFMPGHYEAKMKGKVIVE